MSGRRKGSEEGSQMNGLHSEPAQTLASSDCASVSTSVTNCRRRAVFSPGGGTIECMRGKLDDVPLLDGTGGRAHQRGDHQPMIYIDAISLVPLSDGGTVGTGPDLLGHLDLCEAERQLSDGHYHR